MRPLFVARRQEKRKRRLSLSLSFSGSILILHQMETGATRPLLIVVFVVRIALTSKLRATRRLLFIAAYKPDDDFGAGETKRLQISATII